VEFSENDKPEDILDQIQGEKKIGYRRSTSGRKSPGPGDAGRGKSGGGGETLQTTHLFARKGKEGRAPALKTEEARAITRRRKTLLYMLLALGEDSRNQSNTEPHD